MTTEDDDRAFALLARRDSNALQHFAHSRDTSRRMRGPVLDVDMRMLRTRFEVSKSTSDSGDPVLVHCGRLIRDDRSHLVRGSIANQVAEDGSIRKTVETTDTSILLDDTLEHRMQVKFVAKRLRISEEAAEKDGRIYSNLFGHVLPAFVKERPLPEHTVLDVQTRDATHMDALAQLNKSDYEKLKNGTIGDGFRGLFAVMSSYAKALVHQVQVADEYGMLPYGVSLEHILFWCQDVFTKRTAESKATVTGALSAALDATPDQIVSGAVNPVILNFADSVDPSTGMPGAGASRVLRHTQLSKIIHMLCVFAVDATFTDSLYVLYTSDHLSSHSAVASMRASGFAEEKCSQGLMDLVRQKLKSAVSIFSPFLGEEHLMTPILLNMPFDKGDDGRETDESPREWNARLSSSRDNFRSFCMALLNYWCVSFANTSPFKLPRQTRASWEEDRNLFPVDWDGFHRVVCDAVDALWLFVDAVRYSKPPVYNEGTFINPVMEKERRDSLATMDMSGVTPSSSRPPTPVTRPSPSVAARPTSKIVIETSPSGGTRRRPVGEREVMHDEETKHSSSSKRDRDSLEDDLLDMQAREGMPDSDPESEADDDNSSNLGSDDEDEDEPDEDDEYDRADGFLAESDEEEESGAVAESPAASTKK